MARRKNRDFDRDDQFDSPPSTAAAGSIEESSDNLPTRPRSRRRRGRWWMWLPIPLLLLAAAMWLAPVIVATSPLRNSLVPRLVPKFAGKVNIGSATLGWLSPIELHDVQIFDAAGQPLAEIESVHGNYSLISLLFDSSNLGGFRIQQPNIHVVLRDKGSNLEDALAPLMTGPSSGATPAVVVQVVDGAIHLQNAASGAVSTVSAVTLEAAIAKAPGNLIKVKFTGTMQEAARIGQISVDAALQSAIAQDGAANAQGEANMQFDRFPLEPLTPVLTRFAGNIQLGGAASGKLLVKWLASPAGLAIDCQTDLLAQEPRIFAPEIFGNEALAAEAASCTGRIALANGRLECEKFKIESNLGFAHFTGGAPLAVLQSGSTTKLLESLRQENCRLVGEVDLARLAETLPETLHLRAGTKITSGKLHGELVSSINSNRRTWVGQIASTDLAAVEQGRQFRWEKPIVVQLAAFDSPQGIQVEKLQCTASFLQIAAQGSLYDATLSARADLNQLAAELGQFVDLGQVTLAGTMQTEARLQRDAQSRLAIQGTSLIEKLTVVAPGLRPWSEEKLTLEFAGQGQAIDGQAVSLEQGALQVTSGGDTMKLELAAPLAKLDSSGPWPLKITGQGRIETWLARLQPVLPLTGWQVNGDVKLAAACVYSPTLIQLTDSQIDINNLDAQGQGKYLREQVAQAKATGTYDVEKQLMQFPLITVATTSWSGRGDNVLVNLAAPGLPQVVGEVAFRCDLRRTMTAFRAPRAAPAGGVRGQASGTVSLTHVDGATRTVWNATVEGLVVDAPPAPPAAAPIALRPVSTAAAAPQPIWVERQLMLAGDASYVHAEDLLKITTAEAKGSGLALQCAGTLRGLLATPQIDVQGQSTYSLASLSQRFANTLGPNVRIMGDRTSAFYVQGPLSNPVVVNAATALPLASNTPSAEAGFVPYAGLVSLDLRAGGDAGWDKALVYGFEIGKGDVKAELRRGLIDFTPLELAVSEGKLKLAPRIDLTTPSALMTIERGPLIERIRLTPQMCQGWLKFVTPFVADATLVDGHVSANIDRAAIPLVAPAMGDVQGAVIVHGAQVRPGRMAQQYIVLAQQIKSLVDGKLLSDSPTGEITLLTMKEQTIPVQMSGGRIFHQGVKFDVGDVAIETSGSVGVDQSLDLVASIPIRPEWVQKQKALAMLQGQPLQVAIRGTVANPQIDGSSLQVLARGALQGAASRLLQGELEKLLPGLARPPANAPQGVVQPTVTQPQATTPAPPVVPTP